MTKHESLRACSRTAILETAHYWSETEAVSLVELGSAAGAFNAVGAGPLRFFTTPVHVTLRFFTRLSNALASVRLRRRQRLPASSTRW